MAVYQGSGAPPVLAYNANSDRGWNDPPTMAFAATQSTSTPRKRLDLRKRVAHDCISGSGLNAGLANLSLSTNHPPANIHGQQNTYHHDQNYTKMSSPPINGTYASPGMNNGISQPPVSLQPKNYYTPFAHGHLSMPNNGANQTSPVPGSMTPPVYSVHQNAHHISHASSMPNLQHFTEDTNAYSENPQGSHTPLFNINSPFQTFSTVGETSTAFSKSTDSAHVGRPLFCLSSQANQPVIKNPANDVHDYHRTTSLDTMRQPSPGILTEQVLMNKTMPSLSPSSILESTHVRSNSVPDIMPFTDGKSTPPASLGAPPTEGYYTRSLSPNASRNKTPSPTLKEGDVPNNDKMQAPSDYENHYNVMDQLNFALDKCSATLEKKVYDDVKRKLDILESQLRTNSLSKNVTDKMASLATAITNGTFEEAYSIHQSLMVDYSNEVSQWMIGIKKLIAASKV